MLNKIKKSFLVFALAFVFTVPAFATVNSVYAADAPQCKIDATGTASETICNPIPDKNVPDLLYRILKFILGLLAGVAILSIVIAGFRMVTSGGNEEAVKSARTAITWSIIGLVIALLAYSIVSIVVNVLLQKGT